MNSTPISLVGILLFASAAAQSVAGRDQAQPTAFQATVSPAKAQFVVPLSHRDSWEWRRKDTADNRREYCIDVSVHNNNENYKFGFYMFKQPGSAPMRGDLDALLKAGQQSLFLL